MQNILTILKKELRSYFYHPTAYILLVVFLAISYFFYFRPILLTGESSLRPLFSILPWIMMFFVPAICMGLVSREKDKGTLEILSTQPVRILDILIGKALGAFFFVMVAVLITLTIPLTLSRFGDFDWGVVFSQYAGTAFLLASFTAIGTWASSITKNQVVAFIGAIGVNFALIMAGFEMVTVALSYPFDIILKRLSILDHFYNITRGVIDLRDIIYFIVLILIFGFLAYLSLLKTKGGRVLKEYKKLSSLVVVIVIVALVVNLSGNYIGGRIDLTSGNIYTLSNATKKILTGLENEIDISLVVSREMPAQLSNAAQDVKDLLNDYVKAGKGKIKLNIYYPDKDATAITKAETLGIPAIQFNVIAKDEFSTKKGYFGLAVESGVGEDKKQELIPLIEKVGLLEYQLTGFIWNMVNETQKKIGWLIGHGEESLYNEMSYVPENLSGQYEMYEVNLKDPDEKNNNAQMPENTQVLVIALANEPLEELEIEKINTYLESGGSALILAEGIRVDPQTMMATSSPATINPLLNKWGLNIDANLVFDLQSHETVSMRSGVVNYVLPYPFWTRVFQSEESMMIGDIKSIVLPWASSLSVMPEKLDESINIIPLFTTSELAGVQKNNFNLNPQQSWPQNTLEKKTMALGIERIKDGQSTRMVIVGNTQFALMDFVQNHQQNGIFILNALEWLAQDNVLSSIRTKNLASAPLLFENDQQRSRVKYFNIAGVPILIVLAGVIVMFNRKKKMKKKFKKE